MSDTYSLTDDQLDAQHDSSSDQYEEVKPIDEGVESIDKDIVDNVNVDNGDNFEDIIGDSSGDCSWHGYHVAAPSPEAAQGCRRVVGSSPAGMNQGFSGLPLKGWPLTPIQGIDQLLPSLGAQVQIPILQGSNQFQIMTPQQQVLVAQAQGNLGTSPTYGDTNPQRFTSGLPRSNLNVNDGQP
ncbi:hypothetical protein Syun_012447 [Stephania yunnanensis]|uniref:Uncharacterized protein n=1 Tax=Stephania yunnanensis TaxID=152371 RepID=A0AAP0PGE7_9MAGN